MSRRNWLRAGKGEHQKHSTRSEFCRLLGVSDPTFERLLKAGTIPPPDIVRPENGWRLWSPQQVTAAIHQRAGIR